MLNHYDIVLIPFPFTDASSSKLRAALVMAFCGHHQDVLLAFILLPLREGPHPRRPALPDVKQEAIP